MMERLTKHKFGNVVSENQEKTGIHCSNFCNNCSRGTGDCKHLKAIVEKLAAYEDAEEQGLLLKLPCKVGDTVWDNDYGKPCPYTVTGFSFGTGECYIDEPVSLKEVVYYYSNYSGSITGSFAVSEIGKTVFLTQAEAEQELKEMSK